MSIPSLSVASARPTADEGDALVLFVRSGEGAPEVLTDDLSPVTDPKLLAQLRVTGAVEQVVRLPGSLVGGTSVILAGVGADPSAASIRSAAGSASRSAAGDARLVLDARRLESGQLRAALEGAALGAYAYDERPRGKDDRSPVAEVVAISELDGAADIASEASVVAASVALTRDLVTTPPSEQDPAALARSAQDAVAGLPIEVRVWEERELASDGFGGILGVGSGSTRPPRLVRLDYAPESAGAHVALVGKGITFDSGGLSLKPPVSMVGMKYDMTGAASVLAVVVAAARLELPVHVTAWMCIAENLPSGSAIRPNDVLTIRGGTRVEVLNTDAEGRLVLADGLRAASEEHPDAVIDIATLTGAQVVALGNRYSAVMGDEGLVRRVTDAATRVGELLWPMPLPSELRPTLKSDVADLANATPGNTAGGMLLAGVFLREFVGKVSEDPDAATIPWAHLDIAGPAENKGAAYGYVGKGATGVLVRTLVDLVRDFGESASGRA